jgi:hypothetical protein
LRSKWLTQKQLIIKNYLGSLLAVVPISGKYRNIHRNFDEKIQKIYEKRISYLRKIYIKFTKKEDVFNFDQKSFPVLFKKLFSKHILFSSTIFWKKFVKLKKYQKGFKTFILG